MSKVKVRFAPSPTGYLHIGGARTALFNWLYARKLNGEFILRIEDTDLERSREEYRDEILESIKWLGMDWDQVYYQSQRFDLYRQYARELIDGGKAYRKEGAVFFKYEFTKIEIDDLIRGRIVFAELPKQEEVIIKSDNSPTYNFSCVVDDALMGISCVVRGEDHISNTPKQILMYAALGFKTPQFAHVPLILSPDGGRMSKRHGATSIREYKEMGYLAPALVNYLLLLGWAPGNNREIISLNEARDLFDIKKVNKTGAAFSRDKLDWLNGQYLKEKDLKEFVCLAQEYLNAKQFLPSPVNPAYLQKVLSLFKDRIFKLSDLIDWTGFCFYDNFKYSEEARDVLDTDLSKEITLLIDRLKKSEGFSAAIVEKEFRETAAGLGVKAKVLVHPTRVALTGRKIGPGLFETMEVLGKDKVISRLERLVSYWGG